MADDVLASGTIPFQAEGRLLQELGERLVAKPEVALVELIKNSYDADASRCDVRLSEGGKVLEVTDNGHGMTYKEFVERWMRIATSRKVGERTSRVFSRRLTGSKGIGRFAVRFLGNELRLISTAFDAGRRIKTVLVAQFDWPQIDHLADIRDAKVSYILRAVSPEAPTGTTLEIKRLRSSTDFTTGSTLRAEVLRIVTPLQGLEAGRFTPAHGQSRIDPGFRVVLPESPEAATSAIDVADLVLKNHWARLQIELDRKRLLFKVWFADAVEPTTLEVDVATSILAGFVADIRYFPRRKGIFRGKGVNGQTAWKWVRENNGVAVVDHGFRIMPYGYEGDDWLYLNLDKAHSERDWRSPLSKTLFPIPAPVRSRAAENPALYLPYNFQLVGAVFVESQRTGGESASKDLIPSMDREGFLENKAYGELVEYVRTGIEWLALLDKHELDRLEALKASEATRTAKEEVRRAIEYIRRSPTLTAPDKARVTKVYRQLAERIEEAEEYHVRVRQSLMTMSLLGVVAGFMTHESKSLVFEMEKAVRVISLLSKKHPELNGVAKELVGRLDAFKGQLQYSQLFLRGVRSDHSTRMSAAGQIRLVLKRFESFAVDHSVNVTWQAAADVRTPALPPAVYSGVLLNLYSNALKAVLAATSSIREPRVAIRAWNADSAHSVEVSDNGVGIPPEVRKRIWDPLFTTTSDTGNPLGSGMGLGLTLVKQVVEEVGGRITLVDPPPGFHTCFRVVFPMR